jgi:hypothetical protein
VCVYIFVKKDWCFNKIYISHLCKEKGLKICAVQLETKTCSSIILSFYKALSRDFSQFLRGLDDTLKVCV